MVLRPEALDAAGNPDYAKSEQVRARLGNENDRTSKSSAGMKKRIEEKDGSRGRLCIHYVKIQSSGEGRRPTETPPFNFCQKKPRR